MRVGDQLAGRYRLEQRLGQGGFGEVWRAHDTALERAVAVKVLLEAATNDEVVARFRREATIGARLQHPGITVVHDVGREEGRFFIVMELLSGEDLRTALSREPDGLPVALALELAAQAAEALAAAHERSVIHRDLKPANLFLLPGGRLKICDFGIAHSSDATAGWTVTGRVFGSPPYMAPEQWRGEHVDARCDLYALGCVLYALLSGEPPFGEAEGPYVLMRRHIEDPPLPLRAGGTPVPAELERLVLHLLAKAAADRPETAQVVAAALRGLAGAGVGVSAGATTAVGAGGRSGGDGRGSGGDPRGRGDTEVGVGVGVGVGAPDGVGVAAMDGAGTGAGATAGAEDAAVAPDGAGATAGAEHKAPAGVGAGAGLLPPPVRDFVRGLLLEAEDALRPLPGDSAARIEVLASAADTAARFDAVLAGRLLAEAEAAARAGGQGDGARVARLLAGLAENISARAPARSRRLLADAQQELFGVFGSNREGPLRSVAEGLCAVAPERAAQLVDHHFAGGPAERGLRARIHAALTAADPQEAELRLAAIPDAAQRGAATYDAVLAVAVRDLPAALRLSERIGSAGGRLLALCQVARDRVGAGDPAGGARALERAERELPRLLEERAAWLREESAHHSGQGRLAQAERLRTRAGNLLGGHPESACDEKADHALAQLARSRAGVERAARLALDPAAARIHADRDRELPGAADRARALVRTARECAAAGGAPWPAEAAADPGRSVPPGPGRQARRPCVAHGRPARRPVRRRRPRGVAVGLRGGLRTGRRGHDPLDRPRRRGRERAAAGGYRAAAGVLRGRRGDGVRRGTAGRRAGGTAARARAARRARAVVARPASAGGAAQRRSAPGPRGARRPDRPAPGDGRGPVAAGAGGPRHALPRGGG